MKRLLITGSEGTVGAALCDDLQGDFDLLATTRPGRSTLGLDVCDPRSWEALASHWHDGLDGLIHTVGDFHHQGLDATDEATWNRVLSSNLHSAFYAYQATKDHLRQRRGRIILFTLAGLNTMRPEVNLAAYAAAKAGLASFAQSIAATEASHGVTCNLIAPGLLHHEVATAVARYKVPAGRVAKADELCAAVRYLLDDASSQVTGTTLPLSGAWRL